MSRTGFRRSRYPSGGRHDHTLLKRMPLSVSMILCGIWNDSIRQCVCTLPLNRCVWAMMNWHSLCMRTAGTLTGYHFLNSTATDPEDNPEVDYSSAGGDLLKMMQLDAEVTKDRQHHDGFVRVPFDYYEELQQKMVDMMPDFRVRLKVNPKTRKMVFAADVHSVFDICWYTLARKMSEDVAPEDKGTSADKKEKPAGVVMSCPFCGEAFVRRSNRSVICGKPECEKARKAMNQRNSRRKRKIQSQQST